MTTSKFGNIPTQMLMADLVECSLVSTFQHTPKRFHSVDVDVFIDILTNAVLDKLVVVSLHVLITFEVICAYS